MANFRISHNSSNTLTLTVANPFGGYDSNALAADFRNSVGGALAAAGSSSLRSIRLFPEGDVNNHIFFEFTPQGGVTGVSDLSNNSFSLQGLTGIAGGPSAVPERGSEVQITFDSNAAAYDREALIRFDFGSATYTNNSDDLTLVYTPPGGSAETLRWNSGFTTVATRTAAQQAQHIVTGLTNSGSDRYTNQDAARIRQLFSVTVNGSTVTFASRTDGAITLSGNISHGSNPAVVVQGAATNGVGGGNHSVRLRMTIDGQSIDTATGNAGNDPTGTTLASLLRSHLMTSNDAGPVAIRAAFNIAGTGRGVVLNSRVTGRNAPVVTNASVIYTSNPPVTVPTRVIDGADATPGGVNFVRAEILSNASGNPVVATFIPAASNAHVTGGKPVGIMQGRSSSRAQATNRKTNTEFRRIRQAERFSVPSGAYGQVSPTNPKQK